MPKFKRLGDRWIFECPGCGCAHFVNDRWQFNGDVDKPTVKPSILAQFTEGREKVRCHSFVTDGNIRYLNDCTHDLAGSVVEIPDWDSDEIPPHFRWVNR